MNSWYSIICHNVQEDIVRWIENVNWWDQSPCKGGRVADSGVLSRSEPKGPSIRKNFSPLRTSTKRLRFRLAAERETVAGFSPSASFVPQKSMFRCFVRCVNAFLECLPNFRRLVLGCIVVATKYSSCSIVKVLQNLRTSASFCLLASQFHIFPWVSCF